MMRRLNSFVVAVLFLCVTFPSSCDGRTNFGFPAAGIFGRGGKQEEDSRKPPPFPPPPQQQQQQQSSYYQQRPPPPGANVPMGQGPPGRQAPPPPRQDIPQTTSYDPRGRSGLPPPPKTPPPPPPVLAKESVDTNAGNHSEVENENVEIEEAVPEEADAAVDTTIIEEEEVQQQESSFPPPPVPQQQFPPQQQWGMMPDEQAQYPPQQQGWGVPPPNDYGGWDQPNYYGMEGDTSMMLQDELNDSLARENNLLAELDNMTATMVVLEQREELHMRQLDVLTERVIDVEAQAAEDRNMLVEFQSNCTALEMTLSTLTDELEEWQKRCSELSEMREDDQENIKELKRLLKDKASEAEELAIAIENVRLAQKRRDAAIGKRKQAKQGVIAWLLGLFVTYDDEYEEMSREDTFEMAKSTLLRALQSERSNVHELEAVVASLQQNNSAISEMVESRDSIIDELNNRIAVFEEDKVVLKAALRQLQKEIKEEAPKAEKLMNDLAKSAQDIEMLKKETTGILKTHKEEVKALQQSILTKQQSLSQSESNLTAIGTYVDKLEERLTSFAITRRDMEEREKKCKEIEEAAAIMETEKNALEVRVEEYSKEQAEVKKLLEELAVERTNLQKENRKLLTEREFRIGEQEDLLAKCSTLESETKALTDAVDEWKSKCEMLAPSFEAAELENLELKTKVESLANAEKELEAIKEERAKLAESSEKKQEELESAQEANTRLEAMLDQQKTIEEKLRKQVQAASQVQAESKRPAPTEQERNVLFRTLRKKLSKVTGIHGLITPSSEMLEQEPQVLRGKERPVGKRRSPPPKVPPQATPAKKLATPQVGPPKVPQREAPPKESAPQQLAPPKMPQRQAPPTESATSQMDPTKLPQRQAPPTESTAPHVDAPKLSQRQAPPNESAAPQADVPPPPVAQQHTTSSFKL